MTFPKTEISSREDSALSLADVARREPSPVPANLTLSQFLSEVFDPRHAAYPVVDDRRPIGLLHVRDVARHPVSEWRRRSVGECARRRPGVPVFDAADDLSIALAELNAAGATKALVLDGGEFVGILTLSDLLAAISREAER